MSIIVPILVLENTVARVNAHKVGNKERVVPEDLPARRAPRAETILTLNA
jgi:hypothetical protein